MRKLIIKLFIGEYIFPYNLLIALGAVMFWMSLSVLITGKEWGIYLAGANVLIFILGFIKLYFGKNNYVGNPMRMWAFTIPLFYFAGIHISELSSISNPIIGYISLSLFFLVFFGTYLFFLKKPVKYHELDDMNKYSFVESARLLPTGEDGWKDYDLIRQRYWKWLRKYKVKE